MDSNEVIVAMERGFAELRSEMNDGFASVRSEMDQRFDSLEQKLVNTVELNTENLAKKIDLLAEGQVAIARILDAHITDCARIEERVDRLERRRN